MTKKILSRKHKNKMNKFKVGNKTYEYNIQRIRVTKPVKKAVQHIVIDEEFANENTCILALLNFYQKNKGKKDLLKNYV